MFRVVSFFADRVFLEFWIPVITVALTIYLKFVTRRDDHRAFQKEDLAVGFDLAAIALFFLLVHASSLAVQVTKTPTDIALLEKSIVMPWILCAFLLGLWIMSTLVRKVGWEAEGKLMIGWGLVTPGLFGIACLAFALTWIA